MTCTEYLSYTFTTEELADIAGQLARRNTEAAELEDRKKQVVSDFSAQITAAKAEISRLARLYSNGHEYRNIDCEVRFNDPASGRATIVRLDTGEVVKVRAMTGDELQQSLPFEPPATPPEPEPEPNRYPVRALIEGEVIDAEVVEPEPEAAPEPLAPANGHDACADGTCGHIPEWRTADEIAAGVPLVPVPEDPPEWVKPKRDRRK